MTLGIILGLNKTTDQSCIGDIVHWCVHVFSREESHVLRRELEFKDSGQKRPKRTWKKQAKEEYMTVCLSR